MTPRERTVMGLTDPLYARPVAALFINTVRTSSLRSPSSLRSCC
jgi:hypothetical protein